MAFSTPKGWEKDSDKLFIHNSGVRIQRMVYRQKEGWFLVPTDLDQPVIEFEPTPEGRDKAFAAYSKGVLKEKPKKTPKSKSKAAEEKAKAKTSSTESEEEDDSSEGGDEESGDDSGEDSSEDEE